MKRVASGAACAARPRGGLARRKTAAVLAAASLASLAPMPARGDALSGEMRLVQTTRIDARVGPLAAADAIVPGIAAAPPSDLDVEVELRDAWHAHPAGVPLAVWLNAVPRVRRSAGHANAELQLNELAIAADHAGWQFGAGRKVLGWDVGYAFRPNDFVQQETRRTLLSLTPQGRPLLEAETIDGDSASTFVWVNPNHVRAADSDSRGADESAIAWRGYRHLGSLDAFGFARAGAHTGASVGGAFAWVASDELELHASARVLQRHDGWRFDPSAGDKPVASNPWTQTTLGGGSMALIGFSWTGALQQSLLVEAWHDGSALPDEGWDRWRQRNAALQAVGAPAAARAGNLAWQATPFGAQSLRRDNLYARAAWQPDRWVIALDLLFATADHGRIVTASAQWQGERWRINAAWRSTGGAADSVFAQLPTRRTMLLAATLAF